MAQVRVLRHEAEQGLLPPVCVACGSAATTTVGREFSWRPPIQIIVGVVLIPIGVVLPSMLFKPLYRMAGSPVELAPLAGGAALIAAAICMYFGRTVVLQLPFCNAHLTYWERRHRYSIIGGIEFLLLAPTALLATMAGYLLIAGVLCIGMAGGMIAPYIRHLLGIHPARIDDQSIILKNVSEGFAKAIAEAHLDSPPQPIPSKADQQAIQPASDPTDPGIRPE
jgi:hypothetical protein